jgi:hypothetical protein
MSDETRRILDLLAQGKITVDEAAGLLNAVRQASASAPRDEAAGGQRPRYIRINVRKNARAGDDPGPANDWPGCFAPRHGAKEVSIRVPMALVKNGMRLGAFVPGGADFLSQALRDRGIQGDISRITPEQLETLLKEMGELTVDVDHGRAQVRISAE